MAQDKSSNSPQDIPQFDIGKSGRIEVDIYKMHHGYMMIDQDTEVESALGGDGDIDDVLMNIVKTLKDTLKLKLDEKKPKESISLLIILEDRIIEAQPGDFESEPQKFDIMQLTDIINDLTEGKIPGGFNIQRRRFSPNDVQQALYNTGMIKIRKIHGILSFNMLKRKSFHPRII